MRWGPGLLVTAAFIGPGTITTASLAGARFGYSLIWALLFSVLATIVLQEMAVRLGLIRGQGLAESLREGIQAPLAKWLSVFLVVAAIGIGSAAYQAGNLTGAAMGLSHLTALPPTTWIPVLGGAAGVLLWQGRQQWLERALIGLVGLMSLVFVTTLFVAGPDWQALWQGLVRPSLPEGSLTTVLALFGTTIVPYNLFLHASLMAKQQAKPGAEREALRQARLDAGLSIGLGGLITLAILATASVAFYGATGGSINAANIADQLAPLLGDLSGQFFALGLFAAGLTSAITAPLAGAFAVCGMLGWSSQLTAPGFRLVWICILLFGMGTAMMGTSPLLLILFAQAANGLLLPIIAAYLLWLMNQRDMLGQWVNGRAFNAVVSFVLLGLTALSGYKLWTVFVR
ncbi:Nramp family divalent metal transporter [Aliiglaciecola sp. CAU 1673]|uniref:Nramp family divalent metal transporter n=1 Tax=Aliiglaciecola sp. CAU 1673 TaxID=3032595 RepID=UPI0023DA6BBF|nr:Nramp family divalent metal transporter [Aliiglaciecola sp. CAU 1673]MDF2180296.1 Nramp family divalent metal transporter [Aliiglaciecola sp. CAU 1673]